MTNKKYLVKIRRDLAEVKPESEQIDGKAFFFREGWIIGADESIIYGGETAMITIDNSYPLDAPIWIASGDLFLIGARQDE
jgi:hypothetical protein